MMLDNFRILKLDGLNLTFEEYKEVKNNNGNVSTKWVRVGGYYGSMEQCLAGLKKHIINSYANIDSYNEVLDKINKLNNAIVECKIYDSKSNPTSRIDDDDL